MAKFVPGAVSTVGITGSFFTQLATQTASSGVAQALGQVWQGSGQSFFGQAGQALGGALAGSAVNIALNSAFNTAVPGPQGFSLNSGANILASTITPYVTSSVSAGINQNIQKSLQNAGPFGPVLSGIGTGLVNQATQGITNAIFGAATPGSGTNIKMFPGADDSDPSSSYRDNLYTLTDIVFSLKPAYQGPQSEGDAQATNSPTTGTTVGVGQVAGAGNLPSGPAASTTDPTALVANQIKGQVMLPDANGKLTAFDAPGEYIETPEATATRLRFDQLNRDEASTLGSGSSEFLVLPEASSAKYDLRRLTNAGVNPEDVKYLVKDRNRFVGDFNYTVTGYVDKYGKKQKFPLQTTQAPDPGPALF